MNVWIVEQGEYSDRGIHSVWSTREKADEIVALINRDGRTWDMAHCFEMELDDVTTTPVKHWDIEMDRDGNLTSSTSEMAAKEDSGTSYFFHGYAGAVGFFVRVQADTIEEAVKIAGEKRAHAIAEGRLDEMLKGIADEQQEEQAKAQAYTFDEELTND